MILITEKQIQNKRSYQEDSMRFHQDENWIIAVVCDGMGGHAFGKEASNDAADFALFQLKEQSQQATAGNDIFASFTGKYDWDRHVPRGYTTYASVVIHKPTMKARIEHLGDSSVSLLQKSDPETKLLTPHHVSYFGGISKYVPENMNADVLHLDLKPLGETKVLVFSDGLDPTFKSKDYNYESSIDDLIDLAVKNGSTDNISVYMVEIKNDETV